MFKKLIVVAVMATTLLASSQAVAPVIVSAQAVDTDYSYFCHRTNAASNPYVAVPFSQNYSEVDGEGKNDHSLHDDGQGPFDPQIHNQQNRTWGDIIPPLPQVSGMANGLNWTADGQEIYFNNCGRDSEEEIPAYIEFFVECNADNTAVDVTVTNYGEASGWIVINGTEYVIAGGDTQVFSYEVGGEIVIFTEDTNEPQYSETPVCTTDEEPEEPVLGRGGGYGTPQLATATPVVVADLPNTAGANYAAIAGIAAAAVVALSFVSKKLYAKFF
jgi:hypothetical protein